MGDSPSRNPGPWPGAPVASLRSRTLRPGSATITSFCAAGEKRLLAWLFPGYKILVSWSTSVGRF
jgi:hypothetical protein